MNTRHVTGVVRRFRQFATPTLPRVKAGFRTLYLQCRPTAIVERQRRISLRKWTDNICFHVGRAIGRVVGVGKTARRKMLIAIDATAPQSLLFEPAIRSLAQHNPEHKLHLWADKTACDLYRCAPYVEQIRELHAPARTTKPTAASNALSLARFGYHLGRSRYDRVICSLPLSPRVEERFIRHARANELWLLEHDIRPAREELLSTGRLVRHIPTIFASDDELATLAGLARNWNAQIDGDLPRIYPGDSATQLAYTLARAWRRDAADLGAGSLLAVAPCTSARAKRVGLAIWSEAIREIWVQHQALSILIATIEDPDAVDQLSGLLGETPHETLAADTDPLELAALITKIDAMIAADNLPAQLALAQGIPCVVLAAAHRRPLYTWAQRAMAILSTDTPTASDPAEIVSAYCRVANKTPKRQRGAA